MPNLSTQKEDIFFTSLKTVQKRTETKKWTSGNPNETGVLWHSKNDLEAFSETQRDCKEL